MSLREAAQQALEALEDAKALLNSKDSTTTMWFADEITALKAALTERGQEPYTRERHFALCEAHCIAAADAFWKARPGTKDDGRAIAFDAGFVRGFDRGAELEGQRLAALAEPVLEPVAQISANRAIAAIEEWKSLWWKVPPFASKVNRATREAITGSHNPLFALLLDAQAAKQMPKGCTTPSGCQQHGCHGECLPTEPQRPAEPVQEAVAWIQPDHLQKARRAPFLCRVEPTKRMVDFVPLYTVPPQRKPLVDPAEYDDAGAAERYNRGLK